MAYLILLSSIALAAIGQLALKHGMNKVGHVKIKLKTLLKTVIKMYTNISVILGTIAFGFSTILWLIVLSKLELSYAYPLVSINYVIVAFASSIFFKEKVSFKRWLSIIIICIGVVLVSTS